MITSLELENYRGFKKYRLEGLRRVNLLVGKNGCGKTSVLEALLLAKATGTPESIIELITQRGETVRDLSYSGGEHETPDVSHLFHGGSFGPEAHFSISMNGDSPQEIQYRIATESEVSSRLERARIPPPRVSPLYSIVAEDPTENATPMLELLIGPKGGLAGFSFLHDRDDTSPTHIIGTNLPSGRKLRSSWDHVIENAKEDDVVAMLRLVAPEIGSVHFIRSDRAEDSPTAGILVGFSGGQRRLPIGRFGDGVVRALEIAIGMALVPGGMLMIDEIDTGLHYSVHRDLWRSLIESASTNDTQVFATTHTWDCLRGLSWAIQDHPEFADAVSIQHIDAALGDSIVVHSEGIQRAVLHGIEVR